MFKLFPCFLSVMHIFLGSSSALSAQGAQSTGQAVGRCCWALWVSPRRWDRVFRDLSSSVCLQPLLSLSHTKPIRAHFLSIPTLCPHPQNFHTSVLLPAAFWHTSFLPQSHCKGQQILSGMTGVPVTAAGAAPLAVTDLWWFCFEECWHLTASCI